MGLRGRVLKTQGDGRLTRRDDEQLPTHHTVRHTPHPQYRIQLQHATAPKDCNIHPDHKEDAHGAPTPDGCVFRAVLLGGDTLATRAAALV